jgi:conserved hypothetical phage abiD protein
MGNKATTVDEQIQILKKRGLIIEDEEKAKEQLLDIGYYRLGFYWFHFQDKNHKFQQGISFDDIIDLYYLDTDLKHLLLKIITRIEINFRTKVIYYVSNQYPEKNTWFADSKIIDKKFIDKLPNFYDGNFKKNNKAIKKHHDNHQNHIYAYAWKTLEFFTFGSIINIYKHLKDSNLKLKIASKYNIKSPNTLYNFLETIRVIRNISAHGGTFYDCHIKAVQKTSLVPFEQKDKQAPYTAIKVILFFLKQISETRHSEYEEEIKKIFDKHKQNDKIYNIIVNCIKYTW